MRNFLSKKKQIRIAISVNGKKFSKIYKILYLTVLKKNIKNILSLYNFYLKLLHLFFHQLKVPTTWTNYVRFLLSFLFFQKLLFLHPSLQLLDVHLMSTQHLILCPHLALQSFQPIFRDRIPQSGLHHFLARPASLSSILHLGC